MALGCTIHVGCTYIRMFAKLILWHQITNVSKFGSNGKPNIKLPYKIVSIENYDTIQIAGITTCEFYSYMSLN